MKHFNRAAAILVCLFIIAAPFTRCFYSYADTTTDNWQSVTTNAELVEAFKYYCKSRDLTIEGSLADGVTSFTTQTFQNCCNAIGIDMNALQAHIKKSTDGSNIRFLFDSTGITAYNQIFAQFLQDHELEEGDSNVNQLAYSGHYVTDANGVTCLCTVININSYYVNKFSASQILYLGNTYLKDGYSCKQAVIESGQQYYYLTTGFKEENLNTYYSYPITNWERSNPANSIYTSISSTAQYLPECAVYEVNRYTSNFIADGYLSVIYNAYDGQYYCGNIRTKNGEYSGFCSAQIDIPSIDSQSANIYIVAPVINNNNYEGDTIINGDGTPGNDEPSGGTPPNWDLGGGEGTAEDGNGNTWNITWPSFELPDLNIDWTINGLSEKFPFSIPFDLVSLVTVLSAEPEAPRFAGTIDLKVYQWNYDLDFSQFNTVAAVFRTAETLLFIFGLIMITRKIIRG